jgi:hypothetical protein
VLRPGERAAPTMTAPLVRELAEDGYPVAVTCEVLNIARSSYYEAATRPPSARAVADAELTLGLGISCGRKRVAWVMRDAGLAGVCHRRKRGHRPAGPGRLIRRQRPHVGARPACRCAAHRATRRGSVGAQLQTARDPPPDAERLIRPSSRRRGTQHLQWPNG